MATFTISTLAVGNDTITASYSGDSNFVPSGNSLTQTVQANPTATALIVSPTGSQPVNTTLALTATITASGGGTINPPAGQGTVTFVDSINGTLATGVALNISGSARFSSSMLSAGTHMITAVYSGNDNYTSSSQALARTITKLQATASQPTLSAASPVLYHQAITFTSTVTPNSGIAPIGTVAFLDGATNATLGAGTLSPTTHQATFSTFSLSLGTHTIKAKYLGDANCWASAVRQGTALVVQTQTSTVVSASPNPATTGQTVTLTATVQPTNNVLGNPPGTVLFRDTFNSMTKTLGTAPLNFSR